MSKKHRGKKGKKYAQPDEVFQQGSFSMARFGRHLFMQNQLSQKELDERIKLWAEEYPKLCKQIDDHVQKICSFVQHFHPLRLLHRGYFYYIKQHLGKPSEFDHGPKEIVAVRMVDYIQSVIAALPPSEINIENFDEDLWNELLNEVTDLYQVLNLPFHICHSAILKTSLDDYDPTFDGFYVQAQILWTSVRCHRYFIHDMPHLHDLLIPHDDVFKNLFGISIEEFLRGIEQIQFSLSEGLGKAAGELNDYDQEVRKALSEAIQNGQVEENSVQDLMQKIVKEKGWEKRHNSIVGRFFYLDLFDLQKITNLPTELLHELSWAPGEETSFFAPGEFAGWPLRLWPIKVRPFLCVDGRYYCFDLINLMDDLYRIVERLIIRLEPSYRDKWNRRQKAVSESLPFQFFDRLLPNNRTYRSVYYECITNSSNKREWCETDGIIIYDDHLIIVEIKGGVFTNQPPTTNFFDYIKSIKELLRKPATQAKRFIDYLQSSDQVSIYDSSKKEVVVLKKEQFRHITACVVSLDNLTHIAAQADKLGAIKVNIENPTWCMAIDDLRVYADIFDSPVIFAHFLEERKRAAKSPVLSLGDELDHLGLYLNHNRYVTYAENLSTSSNVSHLNFGAYRKDIDIYYHFLSFDPQKAIKPRQKNLYGYLKEIVELIGKQGRNTCCKAASYLLDTTIDTRRKFNRSIQKTLLKQPQKKRVIPLSILGTKNITVFCLMPDISQPSKSWMRDYTWQRILIGNENTRMMLIIEFDKENKLLNVEFAFLSKKEIPEKHQSSLEQMIQIKATQAVQRALTEKGKISRNEPCPCMSGKKYKLCCGKK
jgi:hypothetical protein